MFRLPVMAPNGHAAASTRCLLLRVERTCCSGRAISGLDPQAATACRTADLRNFSALGVKQQPLTRPARLMVMRAAVSHSSIEIPAANTAIARCSAGFRSAHEILFIACPRDGFRLFFELLPYNYSHTVSDSLSVENDRLVTLHGLFRAIEPHKCIFLSTVALPC